MPVFTVTAHPVPVALLRTLTENIRVYFVILSLLNLVLISAQNLLKGRVVHVVRLQNVIIKFV
jgi:hypothetical protein